MDEADNDSAGGSSKGAGKRRRAGRRPAEGAADPASPAGAEAPAPETSSEPEAAPPADTPIAGVIPPAEAPPPAPVPATPAAEEAKEPAYLSSEPPPAHEPPSPPRTSIDNERESPSQHRWWWAAAAVILVVGAGVLGLSLWRNHRGDNALERRVAAAEAQLAKLAAQPQPASTDPKEVAALTSRLAALEARPQPAAGDPKAAAALNERVSAAERAANRIDEITKRLQSVEQGLAQLGNPEKRAEAADQMRRQLADVAARVAQLETAPARTNEIDPALAFRISVTETEVKSLFTRLNELTRRLDEVATTAREADRHADAATAAAAAERPAPVTADAALRRAFAATALSAALTHGVPFAAELTALKAVAGDKAAALAPLEPFAATGIPSAGALSRELTALLPTIRAKTAPPEGDANLIGQLQNSARQLVRVRRVGDAPGDGTSAILAGLEAKAAQADLVGALAELAKLPPAARAPAEPWMHKVAQRNAAIESARALAAESLAALAKPAQ